MSTAQDDYNKAYWASLNPRITKAYEDCLRMSKLEREGKMNDLAHELQDAGLTSQADLIDYAIQVEQKDPYIQNLEIRKPAGYAWWPSSLQRPLGNIPGIALPNVRPQAGQVPYDPNKPPAGSILLVEDAEDFVPYQSPAQHDDQADTRKPA